MLDAAGLVGGNDYEKLETARLLNSSEYKVNTALGYISLKSTLQPDQVLAVAYEYTYKGQTFQVGEFSSDIKDNQQVLYVKALKNTARTPQMGNWDLMMKNVYSLGATSLQSDKFRLNIKYLSDTTGVYLSYLPEPSLKQENSDARWPLTAWTTTTRETLTAILTMLMATPSTQPTAVSISCGRTVWRELEARYRG